MRAIANWIGVLLACLGHVGMACAQDAPMLQIQAGHMQMAGDTPNSLSPTGALMASVDPRGVIKLWETQGGRLVCTLAPPVPDGGGNTFAFPGTVSGEKLAWSADGGRLLSSLGDDRLALWDLRHCGSYTPLTLADLKSEQHDAVRVLRTLSANRVLVQTDSALEVLQPFDTGRGPVRESVLNARIQDIGQVQASSEDGRLLVLGKSQDGELRIMDLQTQAVTLLSSYAGGQDGPVPAEAFTRSLLVASRPFALSRSGRWLVTRSLGEASIRVYDTSRRALVASVPLTGPVPASVQMMAGFATSGPNPQTATMLAAAKIGAGLVGLAFSSDEKRIYVLREGDSSPQMVIRLEVRAVTDLTLQATHTAAIYTTAIRKYQLLVGGRGGSDQVLLPVPGSFHSEVASLRFQQTGVTTEVWPTEVQSAIGSVAFNRQGWLAFRDSVNRAVVFSGSGATSSDLRNLSAEAKLERLQKRNQVARFQTDLWSIEQSAPTRVLETFTARPSMGQVAFSDDGQFQAFFMTKVNANAGPPMSSGLSLWKTANGQMLWQRGIGESGRLSGPLAISPGGRLVAALILDQGSKAQLFLVDGRTGKDLGGMALPASMTNARLTFSSDGQKLYVLDGYSMTGALNVSRPEAPTMIWSKDRSADQFPLGFLPGSGRLVMPPVPEHVERDNNAYAKSLFGGWSDVLRIPVPRASGLAVANADESLLAVAQGDRMIRLVDVSGKPRVVAEMAGMTASVSSMAFSPDGRYLVTGDDQGGVWLWDVNGHKLLARMYTFDDGSWVVIDPQGRFDTNNLEGMKSLHWVMPDEPYRAYPLELFMRQYFQPQLLERIMSRSALPPVPSVAALNRAQPDVRVTEVKPQAGHPELADVTVQVRTTADFKGRQSGAADLRLFRGGQLVAVSALKDPQVMAQLKSGRDAMVRFNGIRLPSDARSVVFTAYAFNADQVKSVTASMPFDRPKLPTGATPRRRAYVVSMGVNVHDTAAWDLAFAANDALKTQAVLGERLKASGLYSEIIALPLVSDGKVSHASKAHLRAVLMALSGQAYDASALAGVPNADRLAAATPDDLVLITFSGHGYSDGGEFYLVPQDIGSAMQITATGRAHSIASSELSEWLQAIDAGDMSVIIDACHSAAAVQSAGFKPGPMGAKGLGQLAYDKGIRILAATQADDVALESGQLKQGLLTFALVNEGLDLGKADHQPIDRKIDVAEWLSYGVQRVPEIYQDVRSGRTVLDSGRGAWQVQARGASRAGGFKPKAQKPTLFDFRTGQSASVISILP